MESADSSAPGFAFLQSWWCKLISEKFGLSRFSGWSHCQFVHVCVVRIESPPHREQRDRTPSKFESLKSLKVWTAMLDFAVDSFKLSNFSNCQTFQIFQSLKGSSNSNIAPPSNFESLKIESLKSLKVWKVWKFEKFESLKVRTLLFGVMCSVGWWWWRPLPPFCLLCCALLAGGGVLFHVADPCGSAAGTIWDSLDSFQFPNSDAVYRVPVGLKRVQGSLEFIRRCCRLRVSGRVFCILLTKYQQFWISHFKNIKTRQGISLLLNVSVHDRKFFLYI